MKNVGTKIVIAIVVIVMFIPILSNIFGGNVFTKYEDYSKVLSETQDYGFALLYIGEDDKSIRKEIEDTVKDYSDKKITYYMNNAELSNEELASLLGENSTSGYQFISNGEVIYSTTKSLTMKELDAYVSEYSVAYNNDGKTVKPIAENITYYKVAEDSEAYKKLVNKKKTVTMAVFGRDTCFYCNQFKPVYNTVANEYNLDIYYFDIDSYNSSEYKKIEDLGLKIPGSCTEDGKEANVSDGFGTPLTLFTKNGEVIDCIGGYTNKQALITKLKTVGLIKEETNEE